MTKQDYVLIANVLRRCAKYMAPNISLALRTEFAEELSIRNPRFKKEVFLEASKEETVQ